MTAANLMGTYPAPEVTFVRGEGTVLFDTEGRQYLDFVGGLAVVSLGHAHPVVAEAVARQARTLCHVSNLYGNELAPDVARQLDQLVGEEQSVGGQVFFANSGAEANECAIKLARRRGGRDRNVIISTWGSFHGRTLATVTATGQPGKSEPFRPLPGGFEHVAYDDLDALGDTMQTQPTAAVILEPIQGENGVVCPSSDYLSGVRRLCDEHDVLLILDEVQTGLGRTGWWFNFQSRHLKPDVVTMAKALGNGMPVGACWAQAEVAAAFGPGDHGSTFGGQPLALSAAKATLQVMKDEDVCHRARLAGRRLADGLASLGGVVEVFGEGLLLAARLDGDRAAQVSKGALDRGLLVNPVRPDRLRFAPPLLVTDHEIDDALSRLSEVLASP